MFKKLLSSIGVGGAKVDTRLHTDSFVPGGEVSGETHITGGSDAQEFNRIYMSVSTRYKHDDSTHEHTLIQHDIAGRMQIGAGEERSVPFSFRLPFETPLSVGHQGVTVNTGLDVSGAIDPGDADPIQVSPHPLQQAVLSAAQNLGFQLRQAENEYSPRMGAPLPFIQQLEFRPHGRYSGRVEELELVFKLASDDALEVLVELDRRGGGLGGLLEQALEMNERLSRLSVTRADVERGAVEGMLAQLIDSHIR